MTTLSADSKIEEKLRVLRKQLAGKQTLSAQEDAVNHNWLEPPFFNAKQKKQINHFCSKLAARFAEDLSLFLKSEIEVTFNAASVHFCQYLADQMNKASDNRISYGLANADITEILMTVTADDAGTLLVPIMGILESNEFSSLELSILQDLLELLSHIITQALPTLTVSQPGCLVNGKMTLEMPSWQEVLKAEFSVSEPGSETSVKLDLIIRCDNLMQLTEKEASRKTVSPDDIQKILLVHLGEQTAELTCELAKQSITIKELMGLDANDILVLDKSVCEPVVIKLNNTPVFEAQPATCEKHYAACILKTLKKSKTDTE